VERTAVAPVPEDERLALVGDPHRPDVRCGRAGGLQCVAGRAQHGLPDLLRVVLDPTRPRVVLGDLPVALAAWFTILADRNDSGPGGALVEGEYDPVRHR